VQSVLFTVIWRGLADRWKEDKQADHRPSRSLSESSDGPPVNNNVEEGDVPMEEERF